MLHTKTVPYIVVSAMLLLFLIGAATADSGATDGEVILDSANNYASTNYRADVEEGGFWQNAQVKTSEVKSSLMNTFANQQANKDQAQTQNIELEAARANLENSKANVNLMYGFIIDTFIILGDAFMSIIFIIILLAFVWLIFVGWVKVLVKVII